MPTIRPIMCPVWGPKAAHPTKYPNSAHTVSTSRDIPGNAPFTDGLQLCLNRPDGPLKGITGREARAKARKAEAKKLSEASKARREAKQATTKRTVAVVEDDDTIAEAAAAAADSGY